MSRQASIRPADRGDLEALARIERDGFANPWGRAELESCLASASNLVIVAEKEGSVAGFALFLRLPGESELLRVAVAPADRGRGIGAHLVRTGLATLEREGRLVCHLEVRPSNLAAVRLYEWLGFRLVGSRPGYYADGEAARLYSRVPARPAAG